MEINTLKDFAKKKLDYSLDHLSKKALHAIVQGEPSPKGIQRQILEPVIRSLLKQLRWFQASHWLLKRKEWMKIA